MTPELIAELEGSRWLIEPTAMRTYVARAERATPDVIAAAVAAYGQRQQGPEMVGDVAVISCGGPITYRPTWFSMLFGGTSISEMQGQLRSALGDPAVRVIAFRWDSPGGSVEMVPEFAEELFAARGQKPLISICDTLCASAAYWLAAQTDTIYASASSMLGAVGVFCTHMDVSGALDKAGVTVTQFAHGDHKLDGTPYAPLSEAAKAIFQAYVDEIGGEFDGAVARGRGVSKAIVLESFGQGQVFRGKQAISLKLADKLGTFGQTLARLTKGRGGVSARATVATPVVEAAVQAAPAAKGCKACEDECPCDVDECGEECPTCDPDCPCLQVEDADGKAAKAKAAAPANTDEEGILGSL